MAAIYGFASQRWGGRRLRQARLDPPVGRDRGALGGLTGGGGGGGGGGGVVSSASPLRPRLARPSP